MAPARREAIEAFVRARPEIRKVFNIITLQMGPDVLVAVQAGLDPDIKASELVRQVNAVEADLRTAFPDIRWSFFEADDSP